MLENLLFQAISSAESILNSFRKTVLSALFFNPGYEAHSCLQWVMNSFRAVSILWMGVPVRVHYYSRMQMRPVAIEEKVPGKNEWKNSRLLFEFDGLPNELRLMNSVCLRDRIQYQMAAEIPGTGEALSFTTHFPGYLPSKGERFGVSLSGIVTHIASAAPAQEAEKEGWNTALPSENEGPAPNSQRLFRILSVRKTYLGKTPFYSMQACQEPFKGEKKPLLETLLYVRCSLWKQTRKPEPGTLLRANVWFFGEIEYPSKAD